VLEGKFSQAYGLTDIPKYVKRHSVHLHTSVSTVIIIPVITVISLSTTQRKLNMQHKNFPHLALSITVVPKQKLI
jgi:hypothetical protein